MSTRVLVSVLLLSQLKQFSLSLKVSSSVDVQGNIIIVGHNLEDQKAVFRVKIEGETPTKPKSDKQMNFSLKPTKQTTTVRSSDSDAINAESPRGTLEPSLAPGIGAEQLMVACSFFSKSPTSLTMNLNSMGQLMLSGEDLDDDNQAFSFKE